MKPTTKRKRSKAGRQTGGHNRGRWFRKGRGWYTTEGRRSIALLTENGDHLKDKDAEAEAERAYARYLLGQQEQAQREASGDQTPLLTVCQTYLDHCKVNGRPSTYYTRANFLYDFCKGFPARFRDKGNGKKPSKPTEKDRIRKGYGLTPLCKLVPLDVEQWLNKHVTWGPGTRRIGIQALKRALSYYAKATKTVSPIKGLNAGKPGKRITYFTPEIEETLYRYSKRALATAIQVCIRTGARYGSEFCQLTAKHVEETPQGMRWRFSADEAKTHKPRTIYIAPEVAQIVRPLVKQYPTGPLFHNSRGEPWTGRALRAAFIRLKKRLAQKEIKLDKADCMYSTRHTFAKRTLGGFWSGKPCTIEQLAALMGNSRQVCWESYAGWCEAYTDPLWEAVKTSR